MSKDILVDGLRVVIYANLLAEAIDDVRGTSLFKGKAKTYLNAIPNIMRKDINQLDEVYKEDPTLTTNIQNELDKLVGKMAKRNLPDLVMLNQIDDFYSKNPKDWQDLFELQMTKLDE